LGPFLFRNNKQYIVRGVVYVSCCSFTSGQLFDGKTILSSPNYFALLDLGMLSLKLVMAKAGSHAVRSQISTYEKATGLRRVSVLAGSGSMKNQLCMLVWRKGAKFSYSLNLFIKPPVPENTSPCSIRSIHINYTQPSGITDAR
jgi:hypothetical protein